MQTTTMASVQSESEFAALVDALAGDAAQREQLTDLLREDHPIYDGRGTATIVRMRGWVLLAFARAAVSDAALIYVLEELDTGVDAYLVAAAARALRSYPRPTEALAPLGTAGVKAAGRPYSAPEAQGYRTHWAARASLPAAASVVRCEDLSNNQPYISRLSSADATTPIWVIPVAKGGDRIKEESAE